MTDHNEQQGLGRFAPRGKEVLEAIIEAYDREHPDGQSDGVRSVTITTPREDGKGSRPVCQFLLYVRDGEVYRVGLARQRRDAAPNPYERSGGLLGLHDWWADGAPVSDADGEPEPGMTAAQMITGMIERAETTRTGHQDEDRHPNAPLTAGVHLVPRRDGDHRWQMPGFKIRGSVLAKTLNALWISGVREVPLDLVRAAWRRFR
ncbi:hypothetical protein ACT3TD_14665 [Corynebacterium sp. AOP36-E1-14]|uniref:hypothetical protein n=1 Tax=unclassified Corynebacterium TaxID=2624378 RepID=UPI004034DCB9